MSLGLLAKDKKSKVDISILSREVLEEKYRKKEKIMKYLLLAFMIIALFLLYGAYKYINTQSDLYSTKSELNTCTTDKIDNCKLLTNATIDGNANAIVSIIKDFFTWITHLDQPYFYRIMILLGILYLVQIVFAVVMDIVEVILLIFIILKRSIMWMINKFKPKGLYTRDYTY